MHLTQRQINTLLMTLMAVGTLADFAIFTLRDGMSLSSIGYAGGAAVTITALVTYLCGWDQARYLIVITAPLLVGFFLDTQHLVSEMATEIFLPPVIALILTEPIWVAGAGAVTLGIIAARAGAGSTYLAADNLVVYVLIVGGMVLSRLAVDTAQQLTEAGELAQQARQEAEERAQELAQRNAQLQQTLAENAAQRDVIRELGVPILPLSEHALILPLVGALDSARLSYAQDRVLETIHASQARLLVIDLTGVSLIDTHVARGIVKMMQAVQLLGAEVALAGIRSEVAQMIVGLGLSLDHVAVFRDVRAIVQSGSFSATIAG